MVKPVVALVALAVVSLSVMACRRPAPPLTPRKLPKAPKFVE